MQKSKVKIQIYLFILMLGLGVLCFASSAGAQSFATTGNPADTGSGATITAEAADNTLDYTDINDNPKPTVNPPSDIEEVVSPEYGFSSADEGDKSLYVGQTVTGYKGVTNEGNADDQYAFSRWCDFSGAGTGTWSVEVWKTGAPDTLLGVLTPASPVLATTETVVDDSDYTMYDKITAPADGDPAAYIRIYSTEETSSTPTGEYTGANGLTYGGISFSDGYVTYDISKPQIVLSRTSTVDAPKAEVGYNGGIHDSPPGAMITYRITYDNTGNSSAQNVILVDRVPTHETQQVSSLGHINTSGECEYVNVTAFAGTATGWTVWYNKNSSPQKNYGDSSGGWALIGTIETASTSFPGSAATWRYDEDQFNAQWVKWEKTSVPSGESGVLSWGVVIR